MRDTAFPSCFIAMLPEYAGRVSEACDVPRSVGFNWIWSSYLHVTLCYLDWLTKEEAQTVQKILAVQPSLPLAAIRLTGQLSVVGDEQRRSLIAPTVAVKSLAAWRAKLAADLNDVGFASAEPFQPHVTVARVGPGPLPNTPMTIAQLELPVQTVGLFYGRTDFERVTE